MVIINKVNIKNTAVHIFKGMRGGKNTNVHKDTISRLLTYGAFAIFSFKSLLSPTPIVTFRSQSSKWTIYVSSWAGA